MNPKETGQATLLLKKKGLAATPRRVAVLESLLRIHEPLPAPQLLPHVRDLHAMNQATLYRILDLLVEHKLVLRHSAGERSFRYCALDPLKTKEHDGHCHFHCTRCGAMRCLKCGDVVKICQDLAQARALLVQCVEVRLDGLCENCRSAPPRTP